jgi:hypothetical protein
MLHQLQRLDDASIVVDLLKAGIVKGAKIDLDCALVLLPPVISLLQSDYDEHNLAAIEGLTQFVLIFGQLIRNTRTVKKDMLGVDLSAEARQQRCQAAFEHLASVVPMLQKCCSRDTLRQPATELLGALQSELGMASK